jgi:RNA polymerase sigma-70 factor (ECF subfamily)
MSAPAPQPKIAPPTDAALARDVAAGDKDAFRQLMRRYNRTLFRTARAILKDDAEAEDVLQDAYLLAYRSIGAFRGDAKLSTWLVRIVANESLARLRKRTRRAAILPLHGDAPDGEDPMLAVDVPHSETPERATLRGEMRRLLELRIDALPEGYRTVFVLRALEELSVEETAECLGIPEATVRTRFFRARSLLREALSREIDVAFDDAFGFAGERCDRIIARVTEKLTTVETS